MTTEPRAGSANWFHGRAAEMSDAERMNLAKVLYEVEQTDPGVSRQRWLARGSTHEDCDALEFYLDQETIAIQIARTNQLRYWVDAAIRRPENPAVKIDPFVNTAKPMVRYPTGCEALDQFLGGFCGMTTLAGEPKAGKSFLALSAAIEAAICGVTVVYLNAELTDQEIATRVSRYLANREGGLSDEGMLNLQDNFHVYTMDPGSTTAIVADRVRESMHMATIRIVIVFDSLQRLVELADDGRTHYFDLMRQWSEFARRVAKMSNGDISSIVVSELNQKGGAKGGTVEYSSDIVVKLEVLDPEREDKVTISVPFNRSGPGGRVAELTRRWQWGRFV